MSGDGWGLTCSKPAVVPRSAAAGRCRARGSMQSTAGLVGTLLLVLSSVRRTGASYLLTHTTSRTMESFTPEMCVAPELELQRMEPKNLTQYIRTPLESVRNRLIEDIKAHQTHLQLASSRRSLQAVG